MGRNKTARNAIKDGPKGASSKYFKEFLIIEYCDEPIGVVDLHANHPEEGICYLGLLLIREDRSGRGLGSKCYRLVEDYVKRAHGCKRVRLGVSDDNDVSRFWVKLGFMQNGKTYEWKGEAKTSVVKEFDKLLE